VWKPERAAAMRILSESDPENRERLLIAAHLEDPERREALVSLAQYYYEHQSWEACFDYAKLALEIESKPLDYLCEEFAWGYLPYDLAAISAYNLGLTDEAKSYGQKALRMNPTDERLKNNLTYYES
jgi:tetratricopeptide (TPR) repeat protein